MRHINVTGYEKNSVIVETNGHSWNIDIGGSRLKEKLFATRDIECCESFGDLLNLCLTRKWTPSLNRDKGYTEAHPEGK